MYRYSERYEALKAVFSGEADAKQDGLAVYQCNFHSKAADLLPGGKGFVCEVHGEKFGSNGTFYNDVGTISEGIHIKDASVEENRHFSFHLMKRDDGKPAKKLIFLFHGFNEKSWEKYLTWGEALCKGTGSAVVFFPVAFHMQRAPELWSDPREMFRLSKNRKERFPDVIDSSLSNVAISMRLHSMPQRFIWSGLQTYYDVIQLIGEFKAGLSPYVDRNFSFDIFAYSIGGFLAQILKLTNHRNYFDGTRVCLFCSGTVFNRFSPVSKFILDSEANLALYTYLVEHFDRFLEKEPRLSHYIEGEHPEGKVFHAMLDYSKMRDFREKLFEDNAADFYAITLRKDTVIPAFELMNTLQGAYREIAIQVDVLDFDHDYNHINPFPRKKEDPRLVDKSFDLVFSKMCNYLNKDVAVEKKVLERTSC